MIELEICNRSNGEQRSFILPGDCELYDSPIEILSLLDSELLKSLAKNKQVLSLEATCITSKTSENSIDDVIEFINKRNQDAFFYLSEDLLYRDFYNIWNTIATDLDYECINPSLNCIQVIDIPSEMIDDAISYLKNEGYSLNVVRKNIANGYSNYYEVEESE